MRPFSDLDFSAAQLLRVIRPVAERLLALLRPYVRRAAALAERWSHFFRIGRCLRAVKVQGRGGGGGFY